MSNTHTDDDGFEYDGDLLDLVEDNPYADEEEDLVLIALTRDELEDLGAFLASAVTSSPVAPVIQQVIDFSREVLVGGE